MITQLFMIGMNYRRPVVLGLLFVTVLAGIGILRLDVDTGVSSLIPANDPSRLVYQRIAGEFGTDDKTLIYIRDKDLWTPAKLQSMERLQRDLEKIEYAGKIDSLFTLHTVQGNEGRIDVVPLLAAAPNTLEEAQAARQRALSNPLYVGNYFSDDGSVTAVLVTLAEAEGDRDISTPFYTALESVLANYQQDFEQIFEVGSPRVDAELKSSLYQDFILLGPLSALILVVCIYFFMRSGLAAVVPLITSGLTIIWTFGMMGWTGLPLNILSAMLPSLIIVIGSTEDTHMMAAYFRGLANDEGGVRYHAIRYMARHMGLPLILTLSTTALGFASNIFTDIVLIRNFSITATFAFLMNGVITVLAVPVLLSVLDRDHIAGKLRSHQVNDIPAKILRYFRHTQEMFPTAILTVTAVLCLFFIYEASKLYVTNDPLSYFPSDRPLIAQTRQIHDDLAGVKLFYITLDAKQEKAFQSPENIAKLAEIQRFLEKQGVYDRSISIADHLAFVNREFRGERGGMQLPETRQLVAQYLLFFHDSDLESYVSHDFSSANIIVRHHITDSHTLNRYVNELSEVVDDIAGADIATHVIGENLMVNKAAEALMVGQVEALFSLLGLIFLIMSVMFTSFKGGAIAMIPAVIPIAIIFGFMGVLNIPLNPGTAMVAVISIGIAIDGTIHLLARYNELCRRTSDYTSAVRTAVDETAMPLIVSSLALAFGFGILLLSNFTVVGQFGALSAATMLISIIANLLITPIIMTRVRLVGLYQILAMRVDAEVLEKTPLFNHMSDYQRRKAVLISELHEFKAGDLLVEQDTSGRSMYLILSGDVDVIRRDGDRSKQLATLRPGAVFGEIGYIRETRRTADVRARTNVSALRFDYDKLQKDLKFFPNIVAKLNFNISYILGERLAEMVERTKGD
jgi:predicted RND superfamily exporter protein